MVSFSRPIANIIYEVLVKEQVKRKTNPNWVADEFFLFYNEINKQRKILGRKPVDLELVRMADMMAMGHSDYTNKCALYGDDIVHDNFECRL